LQYLGQRRFISYLLKQFYCLDTNAFLRWQNEARCIDLPPTQGYIWPCEEWRGGLIAPWPDGVPLHTWLQCESRSLPDRIAMGLGLARRLAHLHEVGILHRNLSPSCVWISQKNLQLSDFGAACCRRWDDFWSDTHVPCGSPAFASPEALRGEPLGPEHDIYALGALLYVLLTGRPPFQGIRLLVRKVMPLFVLPEEKPFAEEVPPALYKVSLACLDRDPSCRPTAREVVSVLNEFGTWNGQDQQLVLPPPRIKGHGQRIMVFIKGDERTTSLFDAAIEQALTEPSLFLFVGLIPGNLPSGHLERFKGRLYRKLAQGLMRCRKHHLVWGLRLLETLVPEYTALELIRQYRPSQILLGKGTRRCVSTFCQCIQCKIAREDMDITYVV
jgi:hypothetical protein